MKSHAVVKNEIKPEVEHPSADIAEEADDAAAVDDDAPVGQTSEDEFYTTPEVEAEAAPPTKSPASEPPRKRRVCKFPGCPNAVKSQGHCQRHGAPTKRCKVHKCENQAQGSHNGYCKRHWREFDGPPSLRKSPRKPKEEDEPVEPSGPSVYDEILPASFVWRAHVGKKVQVDKNKKQYIANAVAIASGLEVDAEPVDPDEGKDPSVATSSTKEVAERYKNQSEGIPIAEHLEDNAHLEQGWHRKAERLSRGIHAPRSLSAQLEPWEKQLALLELALITGTDSEPRDAARAHRNLAHGWGRDKGFMKIMLEQFCNRRGDLLRKKRVDSRSGTKYSKKMKADEKRASKKRKLNLEGGDDGEDGEGDLHAHESDVEDENAKPTAQEEFENDVYFPPLEAEEDV